MFANKKLFVLGIVILLAAIVAISSLYHGASSCCTISTTTLPSQLYQPPPPKGITVISGNIVWYYNNSTDTIIILNAKLNAAGTCDNLTSVASYCTIHVTKGQKITLMPLIPGRTWLEFIPNESSPIKNSTFVINTTIDTGIMIRTGNVSIKTVSVAAP